MRLGTSLVLGSPGRLLDLVERASLDLSQARGRRDAAEIQPRCSRGATEVRPRRGREMWPRRVAETRLRLFSRGRDR